MFDWSKMPPVSLPFEMPDLFQMTGTSQNDAGESGEQNCPFPFSLFSSMAQMPFSSPFKMFHPDADEGSEADEQPCGFPFPFFALFPMAFFPMAVLSLMSGKGKDAPEDGGREAGDGAGQDNGFSPFGFPISERALSMLLRMDASPETLEKLQRFLDLLFEADAHQD